MGRYLPGRAPTIFISCGELSGEMQAALLVMELKRLRAARGLPPAIFEGNGSARMAEAGVQLLHDVATWAEIGLFANMAKLRFLHQVFQTTLQFILSNQPDMIVLVDNRVFNTSLARALRDKGYSGRIVYYISPVRWESCYDPAEHARSLRNSRFRAIKQYCDLALLIYPVSLRVYEELEIPHEYLGHPLCEQAQPVLRDEAFAALAGLPAASPRPVVMIGALVGSRVGEIRNIGPPVFRALALLQDAFQSEPDLPLVHCVALLAHPDLRDEVLKAARAAGLKELVLVDGQYRFEVMHRAQLMIAKSGTGVVECLLAGVPAIMCYRVAPALAWIAKYLQRFQMPYYSLPNLLANRFVLPELIQDECNHTRIAEVAGSLLFEDRERQAMLDAFREIRLLMCRPQPLKRAASRIQELLPAPPPTATRQAT